MKEVKVFAYHISTHLRVPLEVEFTGRWRVVTSYSNDTVKQSIEFECFRISPRIVTIPDGTIPSKTKSVFKWIVPMGYIPDAELTVVETTHNEC